MNRYGSTAHHKKITTSGHVAVCLSECGHASEFGRAGMLSQTGLPRKRSWENVKSGKRKKRSV